MQTAKEKAANVAASANSGMEKSKAVAQEKADKLAAHNPVQKQMATEKKEVKIHEAELKKQQAMNNNAPAKATSHATGGPLGTGHHGTGHNTTTGHHATTGGVLGTKH